MKHSPRDRRCAPGRSHLASLQLEKRFEFCSYVVQHTSWRFAHKSRSALLPRGASHLIRLHNTTYFVTIRYRDMKAPIAVAACDWAGDAAASQVVKGLLRKYKRRRRPACSLPTGCRKSSQMMSPELGQ
jgi:hypothetical protein